MGTRRFAKAWLYFRTGYSYYFVFLVSGLNALMIAYFVVILGTVCDEGKSLTEQGDILCLLRWMFPHFGYFVLFTIGIGVPSLVGIGYWHYSRQQFGTHAHVEWEKNPYQKVELQLFLELVRHLMIMNKFNKESYKKLQDIEQNLIKLLGDRKLT